MNNVARMAEMMEKMPLLLKEGGILFWMISYKTSPIVKERTKTFR